MTKVGEGGMVPQTTQEYYHKQLKDNILHFENALNGYQGSHDLEEMGHFQTMMKEQMELIRSSISEIKRSGIDKQGEVVTHDCERYCQDPSSKNLSALQLDLYTLQEYNYLPD